MQQLPSNHSFCGASTSEEECVRQVPRNMFLTRHTHGISHAMSICAVLTISKTDSAHEKNAELLPSRGRFGSDALLADWYRGTRLASLNFRRQVASYGSRITGCLHSYFRKLADLQLYQGNGRGDTSPVPFHPP